MKSRRVFIRLCLLLPPVIGTLLYGCSGAEKKDTTANPCQDFSDLSDDEMALRSQMGYTDQSPFDDRNCVNCSLFVKTDEALSCGNCLAMKGPVADSGYCTVWAPVDTG
jgi:hypothetical protein